MIPAGPTAAVPDTADCRTCGACCAYSADWPRFTLEDDSAVQRIPEHLVDDRRWRMRSVGRRCAALDGEVGVSTTCTIHDVRPIVCRDCMPGDDACRIAREHYGL